MYLVGEPALKPHLREEFYAPAGQALLCQAVLRETADEAQIIEKLRHEYLAVVLALRRMGVDFRIIHAHPDEMDGQTLGVCVAAMHCKLAGFTRDYFPGWVAYPRDFCTVLSQTILFNHVAVQLKGSERGGYRTIGSPYGEGGRILVRGRVALVGERIVEREQSSRWTTDADLQPLVDEGLAVAKLPLPVVSIYTAAEVTDRTFGNDHLDRIGCLLEDRRAQLHLVVDPCFIAQRWLGQPGHLWEPMFPEVILPLLRDRCQPLGITVHVPSELRVPYALNLLQFPDRRVLMTTGDAALEALVRDIVGRGFVETTEIPIRYFPVYKYAGIRCLVSEAPLPVLLKV